MLGMERNLGLGDLSQNEKDVFYAVQSVIAGSEGIARSDDIKSHSLVFEMTQPTFHRSLKNLLARGLLVMPQALRRDLMSQPSQKAVN